MIDKGFGHFQRAGHVDREDICHQLVVVVAEILSCSIAEHRGIIQQHVNGHIAQFFRQLIDAFVIEQVHTLDRNFVIACG